MDDFFQRWLEGAKLLVNYGQIELIAIPDYFAEDNNFQDSDMALRFDGNFALFRMIDSPKTSDFINCFNSLLDVTNLTIIIAMNGLENMAEVKNAAVESLSVQKGKKIYLFDNKTKDFIRYE